MPELPEVETIRIGLEKYLVGHKIVSVEIKDLKLKEINTSNLKNVKILSVRRFGKGLIIDLMNGYSIAVHIKLTGQFIYRGEETKNITPQGKFVDNLPNKFTRIIFNLDKNAHLYFNDVRRFGWVKVVKTQKIKQLPFFGDLGPEPFKDLTFDYFQKVISSSGTAIKVLLMDQKKIGGVGNIYANDALNLARIDPRRKASNLGAKDIKKLYEAVFEVLRRGLKYGGATEINYVNAEGQPGGYQNHFLTYGREGEKCYNCGKIIKKIRVGGRGTYFCPKCQK